MAILLINNANVTSSLTFALADIPGLTESRRLPAAVGASGALGPVSHCTLFDVWRRMSLGVHGPVYTATSVASRDSVFLTLSDCS